MKLYDINEKKKNENLLYSKGYNLIAGVDEVGRGPLCGPVVCACVILPKDSSIVGIDDSKKISEKKREKLYEEIINQAIDYRVEYVFEDVIDDINILNATRLCMENCINNMKVKPDVVLIDALEGLKVDVETKSIVHGDAISYAIGAASIVAKVERDRYMNMLNEQYPGYGLDKNKGYGTKAHMDALRSIGPSKIHRRSFLKFLNK